MRRPAWWRSRAEVLRALWPVLTPPARPEQEGEEAASPDPAVGNAGGSGVGAAAAAGSGGHEEVVAPWGWGAALADRECLAVSGRPRHGAETLASGCDPRCEQCGAVAAARLTVVTATEGWCVASLCACAQPWHTRESAWFASAGAAWAALDAGTY